MLAWSVADVGSRDRHFESGIGGFASMERWVCDQGAVDRTAHPLGKWVPRRKA